MAENPLSELTRRIEKLEAAVFGQPGLQIVQTKPKELGRKTDYSLNIKAFAKRYLGKMSGPKKYACLLAYFSKGEVGRAVQGKIIENAWNRMKPLMGGKFNPFYPHQAQVNNWINSAKTGLYQLTRDWQNVFK